MSFADEDCTYPLYSERISVQCPENYSICHHTVLDQKH